MELPEIARRVGRIERTQIVYIEEYVLQYLQTYGCESIRTKDRIALYGKHECREGIHIYMIYAAYPEEDKQEDTQDAIENAENTVLPERAEQLPYEKIGYLKRRQNLSSDMLTGYYIFYDVNELMKAYLSEHYEMQQRNQKVCRTVSGFSTKAAINDEENMQEKSIYGWMRIAVVCIIIIFCAIAVTAVNNYKKMDEFVQTMIRAEEWEAAETVEE